MTRPHARSAAVLGDELDALSTPARLARLRLGKGSKERVRDDPIAQGDADSLRARWAGLGLGGDPRVEVIQNRWMQANQGLDARACRYRSAGGARIDFRHWL